MFTATVQTASPAVSTVSNEGKMTNLSVVWMVLGVNGLKMQWPSALCAARPTPDEESMVMHAGLSRRLRSTERGVTLIEVMIVVTILGLIATGVAVAVFPKFKEAQVKTTKTSAMELRRATEMWRGTHASDVCPSIEQLKTDKALDTASKANDAWDLPFKITCEDDETIITSNGPDKKEGTADDIRVPELQNETK
jgi:general secretion pathway protein G